VVPPFLFSVPQIAAVLVMFQLCFCIYKTCLLKVNGQIPGLLCQNPNWITAVPDFDFPELKKAQQLYYVYVQKVVCFYQVACTAVGCDT